MSKGPDATREGAGDASASVGRGGRSHLPPTESAGAGGTIALDGAVTVQSPDAGDVELDAGAYRIVARGDGNLHVTSLDGRMDAPVLARPVWHDLVLDGPLALGVAVEEEGQQILMLFPGGGGLEAAGSSRRSGEAARTRATKELVAEAVLEWIPPSYATAIPLDRARLFSPWTGGWGKIEPGPAPTGFGPSSVPPLWVRATVATCHPPPAGSYGPGGPGTESGIPPFPPGSAVLRGAFAGYIQSVTPVSATSTLAVAGRVVELLVTSHVVTLGYPTILSMTWTDVYQVVPSTNGPLSFPAVIVATGRVPRSAPAPGTTWEAEVAKRLTSYSGSGAPTEFELRVNGISVATRSCRFNAGFPGNPALTCS